LSLVVFVVVVVIATMMPSSSSEASSFPGKTVKSRRLRRELLRDDESAL
jgi:hypothetical protein